MHSSNVAARLLELLSAFPTIRADALRILQNRHHNRQRQWADLHQRQLEDLKVATHIRDVRDPSVESDSYIPFIPPKLMLTGDASPHSAQSSKDAANKQSKEQECFAEDNTLTPTRQYRLMLRLRRPSWLWSYGRAIEFYASPTRYRCADFKIFHYNIVPEKAPVIELSRKGDLVGVRNLLEQGKASPFDRIAVGWTVLDVWMMIIGVSVKFR
jgi:hypothetical protein